MIDPRFSADSGNIPDGGVGAVLQPETTGRQIVVFADADDDSSVEWGRAGISSVADTRDFASGGLPPEAMQESQATVFAQLGIAVVAADPTQMAMLQAADAPGRRILSVSPELVHHVLQDVLEYTRAYRDGVDDLAERVLHAPDHDSAAIAAAAAPRRCSRTPRSSPGASRPREADSSPFSGRGISVAVLDTGFDLAHPDFAGRHVTAQSFVPGEQAQDGHGHGTHCIGTSCGPRSPVDGPALRHRLRGGHLRRQGAQQRRQRYRRRDPRRHRLGGGQRLPGDLDVAGGRRAAGAPAVLGGGRTRAGEGHADHRRRRQQRRPEDRAEFGFVGAPGQQPEIMAVGALDQRLEMANFSARSLTRRGGQVDIAGPGFQVLSSWPLPTRYRSISGTSMATPHVAGIAALWAQATGRRGLELWATLCQESQRLLRPSVDVGSGLGWHPRRPAPRRSVAP